VSLEIEKLYYRYGPMVLRRCRQLLPDDDLAQEAMQEVFMKILKRQAELDLNQPSSLLYRIATNICLNLIRERKIKYSNEDENIILEIATNENLEYQTFSSRLLDRILVKQTETTRVIALLHFYDGMTLQEVANEVGMSVSGVRKRLKLFKQSIEHLKHEI